MIEAAGQLKVGVDGGGNSTTAIDSVVPTTDIQGCVRYITRIAMVMLEEDEEPSPQLKTALENQHHLEAIHKFISDPQTKILFIQRCSTKDETEEGSDGEEEREISYTISVNVQFTSVKMN
ncbi:hypothetical protein Avbf_09098, partial [Armadillidium vulgare]